MATINKIHLNNSTRISLNDRFTIINTVVPSGERTRRRSRSRSRSAGRPATRRQPQVEKLPRGSLTNRRLIDQLDKRHNVLLRANNNNGIRSGRQRLNRNGNRVPVKRLLNAIKTLPKGAGGGRRLRRTNSLSNIATMNADFEQKQNSLKRSNSTTSIASRLGVRQPNNRRNLNRSNSSNLRRTNSRGNLTRNNSQTRLSRANSRSNLNLNGSRQNLNRTRSRSRSRVGQNANANNNQRRGRGLNRNNNFRGNLQRSKSNLSITSRLGGNFRGNSRLRGGKIVRKPQTRVGPQRVGRTVKRGQANGNANGRGRSRSRSRANPNGQNAVRTRSQSRGRGRGGARAARGGGRGAGRAARGGISSRRNSQSGWNRNKIVETNTID